MQDLVLQTVQNCSTPFYLTGGTALNRAYLNVRYSDDLDFFVNNDTGFSEYVNTVIENLVNAGFDFKEQELIASKDFVSMYLSHKHFQEELKVDFVNDIPVYYGKPVETSVFYRTDCVENILTNKISAVIGRSEIKDAVDLHSIAKKYRFSWSDALIQAERKECSVDAALVAGILCEITQSSFDSIKWIEKPDFNAFYGEIQTMARDILCLNPNSLCI